ncbi:MAG: TRAP-type mannitol/chloroaromatic compound transport system permease large subunit, partial [Polaribacter sp.]
MEWFALIMFICVCLVLLSGYPVAFSLAGTGILFA